MFKSILKLLYIAFGAVMCFLIYSLTYNTNIQKRIIKVLDNSVDSGDRLDTCKIFSMTSLPIDSKAVLDENIEGVGEVVIYSTISQFSLTKYENKGTSEKPKYKELNDKHYQFMYYMFIYNPEFNYYSSDSYNNSGLRFYGNGDETLDYHFVVEKESDGINNNEYEKHPLTDFEAIYKSKRNIIENYQDYDFIFMPFSETFRTETLNKLGVTTLNKFTILGNDINDSTLSKEIATIEVELNFKQQFFTDIDKFKEKMNIYYYDNDDNKDIKKEAKNYLDDFDVTKINSDYVEGYTKSKIYSKSLIWNAIGIVFLFIIVLILVFILLFHFDFVKSIIFRQPKSKQRYVPNKVKPNDDSKNDKNMDVNKTNLNPKQLEAKHKNRNKEVIDVKKEDINEMNAVVDETETKEE